MSEVKLPTTMDGLLRGIADRASEGAPIEQRIASDPVAWVEHTHPLIDAKEIGFGLIEFKPWPHQETLMRAHWRGQSIVVDKSRQTGVTTSLMVAQAHGLLYGLPWHGHVVAQHEDVAKDVLLEMAKVALESAELTAAQRRHLTIRGESITYRDGKRSNYIRAHSAGPHTTRSYPGNRVLLEEVAFMAYSELIYRSIRPMLDDGSGAVALVSTYNGAGDFFCHCVDNATAMRLKHIPIDWRARPDRDEEWKRRSLAAFEGFEEEWEEEHELHRIAAGDTIFNLDVIDALTKEYAHVCLPQARHPIPQHEYLKGVDVAGKGRARTVCTAIDISTDPPHVAVQEGQREKPFPQKLAYVRAFDELYPGQLFIDGGGPGEAVVDSMSDARPRPIALRLVGGSALGVRKRDRKTGIFWQNEPRDRLVTYSAQKAEGGSVIIPTRFRELRVALRSARWEKKLGQNVDELDSFMIACFEVATAARKRRAGGDSPIRGLPATDRLKNILNLRY